MEPIDPVINWDDQSQWERVYCPSSDTFFLCDALKEVTNEIPDNAFILEVGSGSGYVTAYLSRLLKSLGKISFHFTTDININCCLKTFETCTNNDLIVFPTRDSFFTSIRGPLNVVIFNPPYVETTPEELDEAIKKHDIEASYAGGIDGAEVVYDFLNQFICYPEKLAPNFMIILLLSKLNRPTKIKRFCKKHNLSFTPILSRPCQGECLMVFKITPDL